MGIRLLLILAIALTASITGRAFGQSDASVKTNGRERRQRIFELIDRNRDNKLQVGEYVAGSIGKAAENKRSEFSAWDSDGDDFLSFDEFRRRGVVPEKRKADPVKDFKRKDRNVDRQLDLKEFLGERKGESVRSGRLLFFRMDTDEDRRLTLDEFQNPRDNDQLSGTAFFRQRDTDDDGRLSLSEFLSGRNNEPGRTRAGDQFRLFDFEGDGSLSFSEFSLMPQAKPDLGTQFRGRDIDRDEKLSPTELSLFQSPQVARSTRRSFGRFDTNKDGGLNLEEFKARQTALDEQRVARNSLSSEEWLTYCIILVDVILALYGIFWFSRWLNTPKPLDSPIRASHATADSPGDASIAPEPELPSIDDFQIL